MNEEKNKNLDTIELADIVGTSLSEESSGGDTSQTEILATEKKSEFGTFDCMGKNDDFCCIII